MMADKMGWLALCMAAGKPGAESATLLEERLRAAMRGARSNGVVTDEECQFLGACGAVAKALGADHPDHARLRVELRVLGMIGAAGQDGTVLDFAALGRTLEEHAPIGLSAIWREVCREGGKAE